ncbi:hypothetical protein DXG03_000404 [Asterophora parasitica]|uniref:Uncharacterized protein n=1 Tax=Asterophora parasitica TaxID=117018 RepID=A0A9P7KCV9_9AGAR|nr:hypothetical protein DXG03_000404 [Asterophora parasitica]
MADDVMRAHNAEMERDAEAERRAILKAAIEAERARKYREQEEARRLASAELAAIIEMETKDNERAKSPPLERRPALRKRGCIDEVPPGSKDYKPRPRADLPEVRPLREAQRVQLAHAPIFAGPRKAPPPVAIQFSPISPLRIQREEAPIPRASAGKAYPSASNGPRRAHQVAKQSAPIQSAPIQSAPVPRGACKESATASTGRRQAPQAAKQPDTNGPHIRGHSAPLSPQAQPSPTTSSSSRGPCTPPSIPSVRQPASLTGRLPPSSPRVPPIASSRGPASMFGGSLPPPTSRGPPPVRPPRRDLEYKCTGR